MTKTLSLAALGAAVVLLAACEPVPPAGAGVINVRPDANGGFSGVAGSNWTEAEISAKIGDSLCGGNPPSQLTIQQAADGSQEISGTC